MTVTSQVMQRAGALVSAAKQKGQLVPQPCEV